MWVPLKVVVFFVSARMHRADDCMDAGGTTPGMGEVVIASGTVIEEARAENRSV